MHTPAHVPCPLDRHRRPGHAAVRGRRLGWRRRRGRWRHGLVAACRLRTAGRIGRASPFKEPLIDQIDIDAQDKADLIAFLKTLTDASVATNPRLADPFAAR